MQLLATSQWLIWDQEVTLRQMAMNLSRYKSSASVLSCVAINHVVRLKATTATTTDHVQRSEGDSKRIVKPFSDIPSPSGLPLIGSILDYTKNNQWGLKNMHLMVQKRFVELGPIYKENIGGLKAVYTCSPEDAATIFKSEGLYPQRPLFDCVIEYRKSKKQKPEFPFLEGEEWRRIRSTVDKKFLRPKDVMNYSNRLNEVLTQFINNKLRKQRDECGIVADLENAICKWALQSASTIIYGEDLGILGDQTQPENERLFAEVRNAFDSIAQLMSLPKFYYKYISTKNWKKLCNAFNYAHQFSHKFVMAKRMAIDNAIKEGNTINPDTDVATYLIMSTELTTEEVNITLQGLNITSIDTTTNAALWLLYNMGKHLNVQERVNEEIKSILGDNKFPDKDDIDKMPYLRGCIKETLRLYPVTLSILRILGRDAVLSGYHVPKGTVVQIGVHRMSRSCFDEADRFKPERWFRENMKDMDKFLYLPFGHGPRMCVGRRIAELELHLLLARIIQEFKIETKNCNENTMQFSVVMKPKDPVIIKLIDRLG